MQDLWGIDVCVFSFVRREHVILDGNFNYFPQFQAKRHFHLTPLNFIIMKFSMLAIAATALSAGVHGFAGVQTGSRAFANSAVREVRYV